MGGGGEGGGGGGREERRGGGGAGAGAGGGGGVDNEMGVIFELGLEDERDLCKIKIQNKLSVF